MHTSQALKQQMVPAEVWEIYTPALMDGLNALSVASAVQRGETTLEDVFLDLTKG